MAIVVSMGPCYAQLDDAALAQTYYDKGLIAYDLNDYYAAISYFEEAIEHDPKHRGAQAYLERTKDAQIKELYQKAFNYIAREHEYFNAEEIFIQILEIDPTQKKAQIYLTKKLPRLIENITKNLTAAEILQIQEELLGDFTPKGSPTIPPYAVDTKLVLYEQLQSPVDQILGPPEELIEEAIELKQKVVVVESDKIAPRKRILVYRVEDPGTYSRIHAIRQELARFEPTFVSQVDTIKPIDVYDVELAELKALSKRLDKIVRELNQDIAYLTAEPEIVSYVTDRAYRYAAISDALFKVENERRLKKERRRARWPIVRPKTSYPKEYKEQTYVRPMPVGFMPVPEQYPDKGVVGLLYKEAFTHYQDRNLPMAKDYFQKVLLLDPDERLARKFLYNINRGVIPLH